MSIDFDNKDSRQNYLNEKLDNLLSGINNTYGQALLDELVTRLQRTLDDFNEEVQEIVIGQRLGKFFNDLGEKYLEKFQSSTKIPIKVSSDRRTAALGAAISFACS